MTAEGARNYPTIIVNENEKSVDQEMRDVNVTLTLNPDNSYLLMDQHNSITLNYHTVACGGFHTCAIRRYFNSEENRLPTGEFDHLNPTDAPGMLKCFGMNTYGQLNVPDMFPDNLPGEAGSGKCPSSEVGYCYDYDSGYRNITSGWLHSCAVGADGTAFCWGNNRQGEMGDGVPGLLDGPLSCSNERGDRKDGCVAKYAGKWALTEFGGLSAGKTHTCGIRCAADTPREFLYEDGACQNGSLPCSFASGPPTTCVQGELVCWGGDRFGQISGMAEALGPELSQPGAVQDWISVCAASAHTCAVRAEGSIYCWGHNGNNRLRVPQAFQAKLWKGVKCTGAHTCALEQGREVGSYLRSSLRCWGHNSHLQSDVPRFSSQILTPVNDSSVEQVSLLIYDRVFTSFDAGEFHTCALWAQTAAEQSCSFTDQKAPALNGDCWGDGTYGQNNLPLRPLNHQANRLCATLRWKYVSTGSYHTCAITFDDAGDYCATENQCSEYPPPLGTNGCDGCPIIKCKRGFRLQNQGGGTASPTAPTTSDALG